MSKGSKACISRLSPVFILRRPHLWAPFLPTNFSLHLVAAQTLSIFIWFAYEVLHFEFWRLCFFHSNTGKKQKHEKNNSQKNDELSSGIWHIFLCQRLAEINQTLETFSAIFMQAIIMRLSQTRENKDLWFEKKKQSVDKANERKSLDKRGGS